MAVPPKVLPGATLGFHFPTQVNQRLKPYLFLFPQAQRSRDHHAVFFRHKPPLNTSP